MSNVERQVGKKGFGVALLNRLREVDHATTEELAKVAGVTPEQASSRLYYLQHHDHVVVSAGRGLAKVWSLVGKNLPPEPVVETVKKDETVNSFFNRGHGWKPSLTGRDVIAGLLDVKKGDKLLVEYPEEWRHSALVSVVREPSEDGVAQCWDLRSNGYTYVPVGAEAMAKHNVKVVRVTGEKELIALENE